MGGSADGAREDQQCGAKTSADVRREECQLGFEIISFRVLAFDLFAEDGGFSLSGLDGCAGVQAADDGESVSPAISLFAERKRKIKIDAAAGSENRAEVKRRGENADDGDRGVVESERSADD